ncbi:hypothetical protein CR513_19118, partial [Mucuna pruriens]
MSYAFRKLKTCKWNYLTHDLKLSTMVFELKMWRHYLYSAKFEVANVVADALSRKSLHVFALMVKELDLIKQFRDFSLVCVVNPQNVRLGMLKITSSLINETWIGANGVVRLQGRVCVPNVLDLGMLILEEGKKRNLSMHPNAMKMYQDLKKMFWWPRMRRDIADFVSACLVCQNKVEHQKPSRLLQPLHILEWK